MDILDILKNSLPEAIGGIATAAILALLAYLYPRFKKRVKNAKKGEDVKISHNLPHPDFEEFIGRKEEINEIFEKLRPYPHSRLHLITIDGVGGIGKSALALEVAHRYLHRNVLIKGLGKLPPEEYFDTIIWISAKKSTLRPEGVVARKQELRTLEDIYTAVAITMQRDDIIHAQPNEQSKLVRQTLSQNRTLLIVDNLETVDDKDVIDFLLNLPDPTKAIVTTRHRLDVAYPVRLRGLSEEDGLNLILQECKKTGTSLKNDEAKHLYDRTGGVPLGIVWSVAHMAYYSPEVVLNRLGVPSDHIAQFCFQNILESIKHKHSYRLLLALSLFATGASREALGYITNFPVLDRDDGLVELEKLSMVNKHGDRFTMLPLTREFANAELGKEENGQIKEELEHRFASYYNRVKVERADDTNDSILAIHLGLHIDSLKAWDEHIKDYFEANRRAIERGVRIDRIFLIPKHIVFIDDEEIIPEVVDILEKQQEIGVHIRILWKEDVERLGMAIPPDLIIFDREEIHLHQEGQGGWYTEVDIITDDKSVEDWLKTFSKLSKASIKWNDLLKMLNQKVKQD